MRNSIKIAGWAPQGEPVPKGKGSAELFLKLSEAPDQTWRRLFEKHADALSSLHKHNVIYELRLDVLRVWCPVAQISTVVESAKKLVSGANLAAIEADHKTGSLRLKEAEHHSGDWAGIEAEKGKIRFD
jgi:DUF971 family protein